MFKSPLHTNQTVFISTSLSKISLTPGVDHSTHTYHIIQAIKNLDETHPFAENIIFEDYAKRRFLTMKQLYLYCRAEQASWEVYDEASKNISESIYDKYDAIELAEGWGKLADIIQQFEGKEGWEYIHPNVQK